MKILTYILAGSAPVIALVMALQLDAKDSHIERLEENVGYWKEASINHSNNATFQRERCDAFYDVVGDYIDVTNMINGKAPQ